MRPLCDTAVSFAAASRASACRQAAACGLQMTTVLAVSCAKGMRARATSTALFSGKHRRTHRYGSIEIIQQRTRRVPARADSSAHASTARGVARRHHHRRCYSGSGRVTSLSCELAPAATVQARARVTCHSAQLGSSHHLRINAMSFRTEGAHTHTIETKKFDPHPLIMWLNTMRVRQQRTSKHRPPPHRHHRELRRDGRAHDRLHCLCARCRHMRHNFES